MAKDDNAWIDSMRDAVLLEDDGFFTNPDTVHLSPVPEGLRPLMQAANAAIFVGVAAGYMKDPADPRILHWKRAAVEEIFHQASELMEKAEA